MVFLSHVNCLKKFLAFALREHTQTLPASAIFDFLFRCSVSIIFHFVYNGMRISVDSVDLQVPCTTEKWI